MESGHCTEPNYRAFSMPDSQCSGSNAIQARSSMTAEASRFPLHHRWDAFAFPTFVLLIWIAVLMGFVPEVVDQVRTRSFDYPILTHVHALIFVGWLVLLTIQTALVRLHHVRLHRRLGMAAALMVPLMVVLGLTAAVWMFHRFYAPDFLPLNLSLRIADMVTFGGAASAGLVVRKRNPSAHKRLMLLASFCLTAAGFGRWWGDWMKARLGTGVLGKWAFDYPGVLMLILLLAAYDLVTRRRFNRPYMIAAVSVVTIQFVGAIVSISPGWKPIAIMLIGR